MVDCDAVVFDLYGTLLDVRSIESACAEVTADPAALAAVWRKYQLERTWLRSLMGPASYLDFWAVTEEALDSSVSLLGLDVSPEQRRRLMDAWLRLDPFPDVPGALDRLAAASRLAVLSNGDPRMLESTLRSSALRERFGPTDVMSADEVGTYKPSPRVYALTEERLSLPRERLLFVSANSWDASGAMVFGLRVAWVNRAGAPWYGVTKRPALVTPDLNRLAASLLGSA